MANVNNLKTRFLEQALSEIGEQIELDENVNQLLKQALTNAFSVLEDHLSVEKAKPSKAKKKRVSGGKNAYHLYIDDEKSKGKTSDEAKESWKTLSEDVKKGWSARAKELKSQIQESSDEEPTPKKKREYKPSAWNIYLKEYIAERKSGGNKLPKNYMKDAGTAWKELSDDEKKKYEPTTESEKDEVVPETEDEVEPEKDDETDVEDEPVVVEVKKKTTKKK